MSYHSTAQPDYRTTLTGGVWHCQGSKKGRSADAQKGGHVLPRRALRLFLWPLWCNGVPYHRSPIVLRVGFGPKNKLHVLWKFCYICRMAKPVKAVRAAVTWEGDSREILREWPKDIRIDFGTALNALQEGQKARIPIRPMPSIAPSVFESNLGHATLPGGYCRKSGKRQLARGCCRHQRSRAARRRTAWAQRLRWTLI